MKKPIEQFRRHPEDFIQYRLGIKMWSGMKDVIQSVWNNERTSVRACHGISKTYTSALIAITYLNLYPDAIVVTIAPTGRQVRRLLWKEIRAIYQKHGDFLRGTCLQLSVETKKPESYMLGFSTDKPVNLEGYHSPHLLWILDEAKGLDQWVYDAILGSSTGGMFRILEISTTDGADQICPFRRHHTDERSKWNCIHFSAYDSPFVTKEWSIELSSKIQIATNESIESDKIDWQVKRPELWETKVLGNFASKTESNLIPVEWIEAAINAPIEYKDRKSKEIVWGLDIAAMGNDQNVLMKRKGLAIAEILQWSKKSTMETAGIAQREAVADGIKQPIQLDSIGVGAGVYDRLAELGHPVIGINGAYSARDDRTYYNLRAELWFSLADRFYKQFTGGNSISIPDDKELIEDLSGIRYKTHSSGKLIIEKKDDYKKRLGRSPDKGDCLVYTFAEFNTVQERYYSPEEAGELLI